MMKQAGFISGILVFTLFLFLSPLEPFTAAAAEMQNDSGIRAEALARSMQSVLAVLLLMVIWWITEPIPIPATALLPAVLFPLLKITGFHGGGEYDFDFKNTLLNYANPVIYLFLGGFLIAGAMQKWKLDRRLTLRILTCGNLANSSHLIILGIMTTTAFISMWISNTATAAMMLPLGLGILNLMGARPGESKFATALMLGIAWAASIGGVGTIIGSPPNGIALGIINAAYGSDPAYDKITFLDWMKFGVPYVVLFIPIAWFVLLKFFPPEMKSIPGGKEELLREKGRLGPLSAGEKGTVAVCLLAVSLWMTNPFWKIILPAKICGHLEWLDEYHIGLLCGVLLFCVPANFKERRFILNWGDVRYVDWGTLILFGGGIALSDAMFKTGLASWIAASFFGIFGSPSFFFLLAVIVLLIDFLTEITSNTAVVSMMVPVIISIAVKTGVNPVALAVAAAVASSMAFMLPVATPPNALVYGTGYVKLKDMIKAGSVLDIAGWILTTFIMTVIAGWLFGTDLF